MLLKLLVYSLHLSLLHFDDAKCLLIDFYEISRIVLNADSDSIWVHMTTSSPSTINHLLDTFTLSGSVPFTNLEKLKVPAINKSTSPKSACQHL